MHLWLKKYHLVQRSTLLVVQIPFLILIGQQVEIPLLIGQLIIGGSSRASCGGSSGVVRKLHIRSSVDKPDVRRDPR